MISKPRRTRSARSGRRALSFVALLSLLLWLSHACLTSPPDLECRPCLPDGSCGFDKDFQCVSGICRPQASGPSEFRTCEGMDPDQ